MRKQTGTGWNWDHGTINMDVEWWKKIKQVSVLYFILFLNFSCNTNSYFSLHI
jgi:hypothetical protein